MGHKEAKYEIEKLNSQIATSHNYAVSLLALLQIGNIFARVSELPRLPLDTFNHDILFPFCMPPAEALEFDGLNLLHINVPLATTHGNRNIGLWEMELGEIYLRGSMGCGRPLGC
jgi:hypothetical protein